MGNYPERENFVGLCIGRFKVKMAYSQVDWDTFRYQNLEYRFAVMQNLEVSNDFKDFLYEKVMNGERVTRGDLFHYGVHHDLWTQFVNEVTSPHNEHEETNYFEEWVPGVFREDSILRAEEGNNSKKRTVDTMRRASPIGTRSRIVTNPFSRPGIPKPVREGNPTSTRGPKPTREGNSTSTRGGKHRLRQDHQTGPV